MGINSSRLIYFFVIIILCTSILFEFKLPPVRLNNAKKAFDLVKELKMNKGDIVFISLDFGPNTKGENLPQVESFIEHLLRRRIPFVLFSQYAQAEAFLRSAPQNVIQKLQEETGESYEYGIDYVNLGFRPGASFLIQNIAKSKNLVELFSKDVRGSKLSNIPAFSNVKTLENIKMLAQFTGLTGTFDTYIQFFQTKNYKPLFVHGCTSITIPEAFIYLDSGQLDGLFEGLVGAASYSTFLSESYSLRQEDEILLTNTVLAVGHLIIIFLIIAGNAMSIYKKRKLKNV